MKATGLLLFFLLLYSYSLHTKEISYSEARTVAEHWTIDLEQKFNDQVRIDYGQEIYRGESLVAYAFILYPKGYVVISSQDYLPPIKMYSITNSFNTSGSLIENSIFDENKMIIDAVKKGVLSEEKNFSRDNKRYFKELLSTDITINNLNNSKSEAIEEVLPLLSTKWGQSGVYGEYCPNNLSGCNATSFAQIFNYYEWPSKGSGSESYYDKFSGETLTANFDKEYEWWNMLDDYGEGTDEENKAVSTLMYDLGVAMHTAYEWDASSANSVKYIHNIVRYFRYSLDMNYIQLAYHNYNEWSNIAKNQLDNGWLLEYGLGFHSAVLDGYRISNDSTMFHLNFGWNGSYNGYFALNNIFLSKDIDFRRYNHTMIINIYPSPKYTKSIGIPPEYIYAETLVNRSLFLSEYIIKLTWTESPSEDKRIAEYIIYQQKDGFIEEVERVDPENKTYEIRKKDIAGYSYSVGVIDKNGVISDIPSFVIPELR